jgi:hypothetical protein
MRRRIAAVTCLIVMSASLSAVRQVSAAPICESSLPANIDAGMLETELIDLLHRSPTFRRQCERIGSVAVLRVKINVTHVVDPSARAQTIINRYEAGALRAEVSLYFAEDYIELIAHEFEHILEQVDGVSLRDELRFHHAWITDGGAYETRRAFEAGVRARQECDESTVEAIQVDRRKTPAIRHPFD